MILLRCPKDKLKDIVNSENKAKKPNSITSKAFLQTILKHVGNLVKILPMVELRWPKKTWISWEMCELRKFHLINIPFDTFSRCHKITKWNNLKNWLIQGNELSKVPFNAVTLVQSTYSRGLKIHLVLLAINHSFTWATSLETYTTQTFKKGLPRCRKLSQLPWFVA